MQKEIEPRWRTLGPVWWHHHGDKMKIQTCTKDVVLIKGSAAVLKITKATKKEWLVVWEINHGCSEVSGQILFLKSELEQAFGIKNDVVEYSEWLIEQYGGTTASQRTFIRYKEWLNIPCPGTGHDGDPNISIKINKEIKEAILNLIEE